MNAKELFAAGQLAEAITAAAEDVKRHPADVARRALLSELLSFAGELERADVQLDAMGHQDPQAMVVISLFRQLLRAETARREFYEQGRLPEMLERPSPRLQSHLEASIRLREGKGEEAGELLQKAEEQREQVPGACDGQAFDDLRDLDDLTSSFFEVLTSNGKYYWIPIERVELIEFRAPGQPRDLLWRQARMVVRGGPDGEVYIPALYFGSHAQSDEGIRLGRSTDWTGGQGAAVRGLGQREFLLGNQARSIMEIGEITIANPLSGPDDEASPG